MPLRVAINATPLLSPLTGIGNYIAWLGAALASSDSLDLYTFYGYRWRHEAPVPPAPGRLTPSVRSLRESLKPFVPFKRRIRAFQQQWLFGRGLHRRGIAVYHEPNYVPLRYDVPVVVNVHDLSWLRFPDTHPADRVRWLNHGLPRAIERAAAILVDSEFVRQEVVTTFPVAASRVHTVHLGVSEDFRPRTDTETRSTLQSMHLAHGRYVLTVGTIEPRKNVGHVLRAYALLPAALRDEYPLVVAGAKGWRATDLEGELRRLAGRGQVRFLGHVDGDKLPHLMAGAAVFIFASLYEGFGLPPLEAMASGVPVMVSDRASLPEVVGDAGITLDAENPEATSKQLQALLENASQRLELVHRGVARAAPFTWSACARKTEAVYIQVAR